MLGWLVLLSYHCSLSGSFLRGGKGKINAYFNATTWTSWRYFELGMCDKELR